MAGYSLQFRVALIDVKGCSVRWNIIILFAAGKEQKTKDKKTHQFFFLFQYTGEIVFCKEE
jgi:hypothetical protein